MNSELRLLKWREGLLDLTRRNRLIHFNPDVGPRVRAPHGVQLVAPALDVVWDRLARHERLQSFYQLESEADTLDVADEERAEIPERPLAANELRALPDGTKLGRVLVGLRSRAKTSLEEQGINTLFVAHGFLRWRDKDDREMLSPLFLVPVELLRKSPRDPFKIRGLGEDPILNPALQLKLKNDFGLELPADLPTLEGETGRSVEAQLRGLESAVKTRFPAWRVERMAFVGLFSFHKISMFNDLRDGSASLAAHPLVRTICGERGLLKAPEIVAAEALDGLSMTESQLVVEADSSQHRAVLAARRGASFVLQGPPGTGKSQTITNIIAECLENRKTVLFVSEKMAALDVVLSRLRAVGLGEACLELHSSKTNKKEVIYELGATLLRDPIGAPSVPDDSAELAGLRARLSAPVRAIHEPVAPSQLTIFEVAGRAALLNDAPDLLFRVDEAPFRAPDNLEQIAQWLAELDELDDVMRRAAAHPWRGVKLENDGMETRARLLRACDSAVQTATRLEFRWREIAADWGMAWGMAPVAADIKSLDGALETLGLAAQLAPREWAASALRAPGDDAVMQRAFAASLRELATQGRARCESLRAQLDAFRRHWNLELLKSDPRALQSALGGAKFWFESARGGETLRRDSAVLRRAFAPGDGSLGALCSQIETHGAELASALEIAAPRDFAASQSLLALARDLENLPPIPALWWETNARTEAHQTLREAAQTWAEYRQLTDWLEAHCDAKKFADFDETTLAALNGERANFARADATQQASDATQQASDATQQASDATQQASDATQQASDATQQASDATQQASDATQQASGHLELAQSLENWRAQSVRVAQLLGFEAPKSAQRASEHLAIAARIEMSPRLESAWLDAQNWKRARQLLSEAKANYARQPQLQNRLRSRWDAAYPGEAMRADAAVLAASGARWLPLARALEAWEKLGVSDDEATDWARKAREVGAFWRAQWDEAEAPEWTPARLGAVAALAARAADCAPGSAHWLRFEGELARKTRELRAETEAIAAGTRELATRWRKGASVANFEAAWSAQFVACNTANLPQLRARWQEIAGADNALVSSGDLATLGQSWGEVGARAAALARELEVPAPTNLRAARALSGDARLLGEGAAFPARWLTPGALDALETDWKNAVQTARALAEARAGVGALQTARLGELGLAEIAARWPNYRGWIGRLRGAYRADCAQLALVYGASPVPAHAQVALDLDHLARLVKADDAARAANQKLAATLGRSFEARELDEPQLPAQLGAARAVAARGHNWNARQQSLIEGHNRAPLEALCRELDGALEVAARVAGGVLSSESAALLPHPDAPFGVVGAWQKARAALIQPDSFEPSRVAQDWARALDWHARRQRNAPRLEAAARMFGALWSGEQTDWPALLRAVDHFEIVRAARVWTPQLAARFFGTDAARQCALQLGQCAANVAGAVTRALREGAPAQFVSPDANWDALAASLRALDNFRSAHRNALQSDGGANGADADGDANGGDADGAQWSASALARGAADWDEMRRIEARVERDEDAYREALGARFYGENTDWNALESALESAQMWTSSRCNEAIRALLTATREAKGALDGGAARAAWTQWTDALAKANCALVPSPAASFEASEQWLRARALLSEPRAFDWEKWDESLAKRERWRQTEATIAARRAGWAARLGNYYRGEATDFALCERALNGADAFGASYGEVSARVRVLAGDGDEKTRALRACQAARDALQAAGDLWRECVGQLESLGWFSPAFFGGQAPRERAFEAIAQSVETGASALIRALDSIEIFANNAVAPDWSWDEARVGAALSEASQIRALKTELDGQGPRFARDFGAMFGGLATNWTQVEGAVAALEKLVAAASPGGLSATFRARFAADEAPAQLHSAHRELSELRAELEASLQIVAAAFPDNADWSAPKRLGLGRVRALLGAKIRARDELETWLRFAALVERGRDLGLASALNDATSQGRFLDAVLEQLPPREQVGRAFWRRFWAQWLRDLTPHNTTLRGWNGAARAQQCANFVAADERSQRRAAQALQQQLSARRPRIGDDYKDSRAQQILLHEAGKKTRHMALRQLFREIPDYVQRLKPCFLMSPLSVAHFLELGALRFDVVVFDEASQICPEDAIGAIGRAAQMIVVGDKQQLPPTKIFAGAALEDDFDDGDETADAALANEAQNGDWASSAMQNGDENWAQNALTNGANLVAPNAPNNGEIESILTHCETVGLPQISLLWHYRSRHEELIAFSNRHFYDARLQTFPAPRRAGSAGVGAGALEWIRVQGFYQPATAGAGRAGGTNRIEARHVAALVAQHARQSPALSLGIITFNEPQRRAVEEEITRLSLRDRALENFVADDGDEPFFVKALENVQGDERDAIFFSVGFGPRQGAGGQVLPMLMSFGPLTREGGERRLNVAVTRAKSQIKIVTSFDPGQIRSEKLKNKGGKLLRSYIEWAGADKTGAASNGNVGASDLARAVAGALEKRGWTCALNVGLGDYRVDVGVVDAHDASVLRLGIVLDGPFYASAQTVRDRDRLRPLVLRNLGWQLWPLWSVDCAQEFERQIEKIDAHLRGA